jgi:hypothetical protein
MRIAAEIDSLLVVSTTEVSKRLGLQVTGTFLKSLGLRPHAELPNGVFWLQGDIPAIRDALVAFLKGRDL